MGQIHNIYKDVLLTLEKFDGSNFRVQLFPQRATIALEKHKRKIKYRLMLILCAFEQ